MPHAVRLRKVGGSVMLAIPKPMLEALDLAPEAAVDLSIRAGGSWSIPSGGGAIRSTNCWRSASPRRGAPAPTANGRRVGPPAAS